MRVPVLVIQGEEDEFGTLRQVDAIEAGCGATVRRLVLPGCGHTPHRDDPERTLEVMTRFVKTLANRPPP